MFSKSSDFWPCIMIHCMLSKERSQEVPCVKVWISSSSEGAERAGKFEVHQKIHSLTAAMISERLHGAPKPLP